MRQLSRCAPLRRAALRHVAPVALPRAALRRATAGAVLRAALRAAAGAAVLAVPGLGAAAPLAAEYEVHAGGLTVMRVQAVIDLDAPGGGYRVATRIRLTGVAGVFSSGDQVTSVEGRWHGTEPLPRHYRVSGTWRGAPRQVAIDYGPDGSPQVLAMVPPNQDREAVPIALQRGTTDALSALAKLSRTAAATGRCDLAAATYDGRRRADNAARTARAEMVAAAGGPPAPSLRCEIESRLVAGRRADQDPDDAARPQPATAWLAPVGPGAAMLPVRVELPSRWFGTVRVLLTGVGPAPPGSAVQQLAEQAR